MRCVSELVAGICIQKIKLLAEQVLCTQHNEGGER